MGFAEMRLISGGLPTVPDVSDLFVDACVIGCPPSFVPPPWSSPERRAVLLSVSMAAP